MNCFPVDTTSFSNWDPEPVILKLQAKIYTNVTCCWRWRLFFEDWTVWEPVACMIYDFYTCRLQCQCKGISLLESWFLVALDLVFRACCSEAHVHCFFILNQTMQMSPEAADCDLGWHAHATDGGWGAWDTRWLQRCNCKMVVVPVSSSYLLWEIAGAVAMFDVRGQVVAFWSLFVGAYWYSIISSYLWKGFEFLPLRVL